MRGRISAQDEVLLPPWVRSDRDYYQQCVRCHKCISACPENILIKDKADFPQVNFSAGGCDYCGACAGACQHDVFYTDLRLRPWNQFAEVNQDCLSYIGVTCQSCKDSCDIGAIRFSFKVAQTPQPLLDTKACTGCGMCVSVCPAKAIHIRHDASSKQQVQTHAV